MFNLSKEYLCLQLVKSGYIVHLGFLFTFLGVLSALFYSDIINYVYPEHNNIVKKFKENENEYSNSYMKIGEIIFSTLIDISFIVITAYIIRKIIKRIPFSFDGVCNFDRKLVKEINGGVILSAAVITYYSVVDKLKIFKKIWEINRQKLTTMISTCLILMILLGNLLHLKTKIDILLPFIIFLISFMVIIHFHVNNKYENTQENDF